MQTLNIGSVYVCKVKKLLQHGIIIETEEPRRDGFVHISELSKRWVRDVKDVAKEGDKIVCKLIKMDAQGIEFSAKRVTDNEKRQALKEWSIENRISRIIDKNYVNEAASVKQHIREKYGSIYGLYASVYKNGETALEAAELNRDTARGIAEFIEKTKKKITIKTDLIIKDFSEDGVEKIKRFLLENYSDVADYNIVYVKAPHYMLTVNAGEPKRTLGENKKILEKMEKLGKKDGIDFTYKELKE